MGLSTNDKLSMALDDIPSKKSGHRSGRYNNNRYNNRQNNRRSAVKHIIRISNLNHTIRDNDLMELFSSIGPVVKTWVDYDRTDRSLGTGGCIYERESDAKQALSQFNGRKIEGVPVNLEYQRSKSISASRFRPRKGLRKPEKCPW